MDVPYIIRWVARNESHEEFLKCAGTDTDYLVPWSDRSSPLILKNLQKCENYALSKKWLPSKTHIYEWEFTGKNIFINLILYWSHHKKNIDLFY